MLENWKLALNKRHLDISISYTVSQESLSATRQKLLPLYVPVKYIMKMGLSYWILLAYSYFAQTKCFKAFSKTWQCISWIWAQRDLGICL